MSAALDAFHAELGPLRLPRAYCPYDPSVKQEWFLRRDELEVFFGGAAGPGKSWGLLMAGLQYVDVPGYNAVILRTVLQDHMKPKALIPVSHEWLGGTDAYWNGSLKQWTFPSGATLAFGYLRNDADLSHWKGPAYAFVGFDELTEFPEGVYLGINRVLRDSPEIVPGIRVPLRKRAASNPGGPGHCVPYGDVLTPCGWRRIQALAVGDPVYAVDASGHLVPSQVEQVHRHESEVVTVDARGFHLAVTPEHRIAKVGGTREQPGRPFTLVPFASLPGQVTILRSVGWQAPAPPPIVAARPEGLRRSRTPQPDTLTALQYARLLGWYLTEGHLVDRDRAIGISQSKPGSRERLRSFLEDDCGFAVSWSDSGATIYAAGWWKRVKEEASGYCREKAVPAWLKSVDVPALTAFLESAMDGDGHWESPGRSGAFYTFSSALADDFSEIAVKLGYIVRCSSRPRPEREGLEYRVDIKRTLSGGTEVLTGNHVYDVTTSTGRRSRIARLPVQPVYCIGLPEHHAFVIRQNGSVWVSGNSWVKTRLIDPRTRDPGAVTIRAKITDNPKPGFVEEYLPQLAHLSPVDRLRLINGDWDVSEEGGKFRREAFAIVDDAAPYLADAVKAIRYWDLAGTEPSPSNTNPDWTVGLLLVCDRHGMFTVCDVVRGRWNDADVEKVVRATAELDRSRVAHVPVYTFVEQDPGQAGKAQVSHYKRTVLQGFPCYAGSTRIRGVNAQKMTRAATPAAAVANNLYRIASFAPTNTEHGSSGLHDFLDEVAIFPNGDHDDCVDALSGAHNHLTTKIPDQASTSVGTSRPRGRIPGVDQRGAGRPTPRR